MRESDAWAMPRGSVDEWAEDYERGRPGWPAEVLDVVPIPRSATVVEVGAGTGKLTRLLATRFARVVAVEPSDAMRRLLVESAAEVEAVDAAAEELPLRDASVDAVFAAEAFHKFEGDRAVREFARVLRPGGVLVLLWNLPAGPTEPSIAAAERFLEDRAPPRTELGYDPLDLSSKRYASGAWREPFEGSAFGDLHESRVPNPQEIDRDGLVAFFASMGWLGDLPDAERLPLLDELRSLLPAPEYQRTWETRVHWTRR